MQHQNCCKAGDLADFKGLVASEPAPCPGKARGSWLGQALSPLTPCQAKCRTRSSSTSSEEDAECFRGGTWLFL